MRREEARAGAEAPVAGQVPLYGPHPRVGLVRAGPGPAASAHQLFLCTGPCGARVIHLNGKRRHRKVRVDLGPPSCHVPWALPPWRLQPRTQPERRTLRTGDDVGSNPGGCEFLPRLSGRAVTAPVPTGQKLLDSLAEMWDFFFSDVLPTLQAIFYPVQVSSPRPRDCPAWPGEEHPLPLAAFAGCLHP